MTSYVMLIVLMLSNVQASSAQTDAELADVRAAIHRVQTKLDANVKQANRAPKLPNFMETASAARRLVSASNIDFTALCGSKCWGLFTAAIPKMSVDMAKNCPQEANVTCDLEAEKKKQEEDANKPKTCLFDMCSMSMGPLGTLSDVCSGNVIELLGPTSNYKMSLCSLSSISMICDSACHADCQANNAAERTLFCAPKDPNATKNEPVECRDPAPSSTNTEDAFNLMCVKNNKGENCQALAGEWTTKGAFAGDPTDVFPDPCAINCSSITGQAIAAMGCCWGTFINMAEGNTAFMKEKELRAVKAATFKCAGMKGMEVCNTGTMLPTEVLSGKVGVSTCPATTLEVRKFQAQLAKKLKVPSSHVSIVACLLGEKSGCEGGSISSSGRRLPSAIASLNYAVKLTGSNATALAVKKASVSSDIQAELAKAPTPTSTHPATTTAGVTQPATTTAGVAAGPTTGVTAAPTRTTAAPDAVVSMANRDSASWLLGMLMTSLCFY